MQIRLKQCGKGKVESHPEIEPEDIRKLYSSFDVETPGGLQENVWFDIMFRLCRRGRENLRQMTKSSLAVAVDATDAKSVFQVEDEYNRNHSENDTSSDTPNEGSVYAAVEGHSLCPVKTFELYKSKPNPNCPLLWTNSKENPTNADDCWYSKSPLREKTLGAMMATMSQKYNFSQRYTNHSVRVTSIQMLDDAFLQDRHNKNFWPQKRTVYKKTTLAICQRLRKERFPKRFQRLLVLKQIQIVYSQSLAWPLVEENKIIESDDCDALLTSSQTEYI